MNRFISVIKRSLGILPRGYTNFDVSRVRNAQPNSIGIISTCLFGDFTGKNADELRKVYLNTLLKNGQYTPIILPGWVMRVYVPPSLPEEIIQEMIQHGCEVYVMKEDPVGYSGTMWRFLPAAGCKPFISHDADMSVYISSSGIAGLEKNVDKWLLSDKPFFHRKLHIISNLIPVSAGMWGAKHDKDGNPPIPDIKERMEGYDTSKFGSDEAFLTKEIWPEFKRGSHVVRNTIEIVFNVVAIIFVVFLIIFIFMIIRR